METIPLNTDSSSEAVLELLFKLKVKDVMTTNVITASPNDTLRNIQTLMRDNSITGIPVAQGKTLIGIVSMDDIVNALDKGWIEDTAEHHMTQNIIVLQETMPVSFCVSYFNKFKFGRFPVLNNDNELTGIVTTSDVIAALLVAMNQEVERLENEAQAVQHETDNVKSDRGKKNSLLKSAKSMQAQPNRVIEFKTEPFNFETAGKASTEIKKVLKNMGIDPAVTRRVGIASYELEINQVVHSQGGIMRYYISPERLCIEAADIGPGIPDISKALTEGFSTATDKVRALGFGAGMGLPNTKRVSDDFAITSTIGTGTTVHARFNLLSKDEGTNDNK